MGAALERMAQAGRCTVVKVLGDLGRGPAHAPPLLYDTVRTETISSSSLTFKCQPQAHGTVSTE